MSQPPPLALHRAPPHVDTEHPHLELGAGDGSHVVAILCNRQITDTSFAPRDISSNRTAMTTPSNQHLVTPSVAPTVLIALILIVYEAHLHMHSVPLSWLSVVIVGILTGPLRGTLVGLHEWISPVPREHRLLEALSAAVQRHELPVENRDVDVD